MSNGLAPKPPGDNAAENGQGWLLCTVTQEGGTAARLGAVLFHGIRGSGLWLAPANPTRVDRTQSLPQNQSLSCWKTVKSCKSFHIRRIWNNVVIWTEASQSASQKMHVFRSRNGWRELAGGWQWQELTTSVRSSRRAPNTAVTPCAPFRKQVGDHH